MQVGSWGLGMSSLIPATISEPVKVVQNSPRRCNGHVLHRFTRAEIRTALSTGPQRRLAPARPGSSLPFLRLLSHAPPSPLQSTPWTRQAPTSAADGPTANGSVAAEQYKYDGFEASLALIEEELRRGAEQGDPVAGLLGFSQVGCVKTTRHTVTLT